MGFETVTITSAGGRTEAQFVPAVNMVCSSLVHDGVERLELRRGLATYAEAGKTMGIPLLYPWANRLSRFGYRAAGKQVTLDESDERIPRDGEGLPQRPTHSTVATAYGSLRPVERIAPSSP